MQNEPHNSKTSFSNTRPSKQDKDFKRYRTQQKTIFHYLQNHTATASMITEATGIPQKSICRYKRNLEKEGKLYEVEKKLCKATDHLAWYLTTNAELFPNVELSKSSK